MLLHVQKPPDVTPEYVWLNPEVKRRREIERRLAGEKILARANALLARQGLISHRQAVVEGDPASEIIKFADETGTELIVTGSHGRSGLLHLFLGSVSRKVLNEAKCPVMIVRRAEPREATIGDG
jgi:nucleotide-binding universal stress UspA family protein